ncbi:hypothetical protein EDB81DRAFT_770975 [Dactylonectria macrodidyma]|uniref:Uncharacterized protein n=1 Tax=Dactylonectria macrodidyma TaxID=307937 RepID=A0A9P9JIC0_9HYPO|nr:hypothetical protein EDB81DRAFT_770975 [Dactylonectria macrodidyma]
MTTLLRIRLRIRLPVIIIYSRYAIPHHTGRSLRLNMQMLSCRQPTEIHMALLRDNQRSLFHSSTPLLLALLLTVLRRLPRRLGFLVANALENWTDIDWFAHRYINWKCYRGISLEQRIKAFMDDDPARNILIARKVREGIAYNMEVDRLKVNSPSREHKNGTVEAAPDCKENPASEHSITKHISSWGIQQDNISCFIPAAPTLTLWGAVILVAGTSYLLRKHIA